MRATDAAGITSDVVDVPFGIDQNPPTLSETTMGSSSGWQNTTFTLGGAATDAVGLSSISVTEQKDGGAVSPIAGATMGSGTWTTPNLPTTGLVSGSYSYLITLTDLSGKTSTLSRTVVVDLIGPTLDSITNPISNEWMSGSAYTIRGTASDALSGVAQVRYLVAPSAEDHSADSFASWTLASGSTSWSATLDLNSIGEGNHKLWVRARDNAGNVTTSASTVAFGIDQNPPSLSAINFASGAQYTNAIFHLDATAADSNALASLSVTQAKNGGSALSVFSQSYSGTSQSWSLTGLPRDPADPSTPASGSPTEGSYEYVITVTDIAGKTTTATRTVTVDTTPPLLTISAPSANSWVDTATYTIRGTVSDGAGKGVASLAWSLDNATWTPITLSGLNWSTSIDVSGGGEGAKTLYLKASDGLNPDATVNAAFSYDLSNPTITETVINTTNLVYQTVDFTLGGSIADTNAVANLQVEASKNGGPYTVVLSQAQSGQNAAWTYSKTVDPSGAHADDGAYAYRVTVTDAAGKTTSLNRLVTVDTTRPVVAVAVPSAASWNQGTNLTISGTVSEVNPVPSVEYAVDAAPWTAPSGARSWFATLKLDMDGAGPDTGLAEGNHTLHVRATDAAGLRASPRTWPSRSTRILPP